MGNLPSLRSDRHSVVRNQRAKRNSFFSKEYVMEALDLITLLGALGIALWLAYFDKSFDNLWNTLPEDIRNREV